MYLYLLNMRKRDVFHKTGSTLRIALSSEGRATATENFDVWFLRHANGQTDRQANIQRSSSRYFAPGYEVISGGRRKYVNSLNKMLTSLSDSRRQL